MVEHPVNRAGLATGSDVREAEAQALGGCASYRCLLGVAVDFLQPMCGFFTFPYGVFREGRS